MEVTVPLQGLSVEALHGMIGKPVTLTVNNPMGGPVSTTGVLELLKTSDGLVYVLFHGSVTEQTEVTFSEELTANFTYIKKENRR